MTDKDMEQRLKGQDGLFYANLGGAQAVLEMMRWAYDKACEDCAAMLDDFRSNPECKNMFVHAPTVCRNLKHGVGSALRHGENR